MKNKIAEVIFREVIKAFDDILLVFGVGFLVYGIFLIYKPAGYITLGICFLGLAYLMAQRDRR